MLILAILNYQKTAASARPGLIFDLIFDSLRLVGHSRSAHLGQVGPTLDRLRCHAQCHITHKPHLVSNIANTIHIIKIVSNFPIGYYITIPFYITWLYTSLIRIINITDPINHQSNLLRAKCYPMNHIRRLPIEPRSHSITMPGCLGGDKPSVLDGGNRGAEPQSSRCNVMSTYTHKKHKKILVKRKAKQENMKWIKRSRWRYELIDLLIIFCLPFHQSIHAFIQYQS